MTNYDKTLDRDGKSEPQSFSTEPWRNSAGIVVCVLARVECGLETVGESWIAVCEHHSAHFCSTKANATASANKSWDWCEECRKAKGGLR